MEAHRPRLPIFATLAVIANAGSEGPAARSWPTTPGHRCLGVGALPYLLPSALHGPCELVHAVFRIAARRESDVVHARAGSLGLAARDVCDRGGAEGGTERLHPLLPDSTGFLPLLADDAVQGLHDLEDVDVIRRAGQPVTALGAAVADQDSRPAQRREELLEELNRDIAAIGDLTDRHRGVAGAGELRQRQHRVT